MNSKVRGNALTTDLRRWFLGHHFSVLRENGCSESEAYSELNRLGCLNNAKFRAEFVTYYGKEWWDNTRRKY
jgi:hypothetical protein